MGRAASVDKNGLKKGPWSQEEDDKLRAYVLRYGHWNWRQLPRFAGLSRCGKSCRLRWMNYLRPGLKRGNFTEDEDDLIIQLHKELGNRWSRIAAKLPGRTDNEIKNRWHTHLQKIAKKHHTTPETVKKTHTEISQPVVSQFQAVANSPSNATTSESFPFSQETYNDFSLNKNYYVVDQDSATSIEMLQGSGEDVWTQPLITGNTYNQVACYPLLFSSFMNSDVFPDSLTYSMEVHDESSGDFWTQPFTLDNINVYNQDDYGSMFFTEDGYISSLSYA